MPGQVSALRPHNLRGPLESRKQPSHRTASERAQFDHPHSRLSSVPFYEPGFILLCSLAARAVRCGDWCSQPVRRLRPRLALEEDIHTEPAAETVPK